MSTTPTSGHTSKEGAVPLLIVGLAALIAWLALTVMQIQTSESLFLHGPAFLSRPHWETLIQPYDFITGNLSSDITPAFIVAWIAELFTLIIIVGFEHALFAVSRTWSKLRPLFFIIAFGLVGYNIYTDYNYGTWGFWPQLGFAIAMLGGVVFCGIIGTHFLQVAVNKFRH